MESLDKGGDQKNHQHVDYQGKQAQSENRCRERENKEYWLDERINERPNYRNDDGSHKIID